MYGQLIKSLDRDKIVERSRKNGGEKYVKSFNGFTHLLKHDEIVARDRAYINYEKYEELTERKVVYVTKIKKNLKYKVLEDCMDMNPNGLMEYREQVVVFRKDDVNHIARIITYVDIRNWDVLLLATSPLFSILRCLEAIQPRFQASISCLFTLTRPLLNFALRSIVAHIVKISVTRHKVRRQGNNPVWRSFTVSEDA